MAKKPSEVSDDLAAGVAVDPSDLPPAPEAVPDAAPAPNYTDGTTEKKTERILVWQEGLRCLPYLHEHAKAREVVIGGQPFDHCDTTADGTWVYRCDRRN